MDGVAERSCMWIIGEAAGVRGDREDLSVQSSAAQISHTFSCRLLRIDGVFRRMFMASDAETARSAGSMAEKTDEVPSVIYYVVRACRHKNDTPIIPDTEYSS